MKNDTNSTVLYTSAWRHDYITVQGEQVPTFTYGRDGRGNLVPKSDTITAADLATAGVVNNYDNGYKLRVDQQYSEYVDLTTGISRTEELEQISPVWFVATNAASFNTNWLTLRGRYIINHLDVAPLSLHPYISHAYYDPLIAGRFRLAYADNPEENIVEDTGNIYCPQKNTLMVYGLLEKGRRYAARATGKLESGMELDTGWNEFTPDWTDTAESYIHLKSYYVRDMPCLFVRFEADDGYDLTAVTSPANRRGWTIKRIRTDTGEESVAGIIPRGQNGMFDFGARNNTEYIYRAYYGIGAENGNMYQTETPIKMRYYWNWAIIECKKQTASYEFIAQHYVSNAMYHVVRVHQFQANVDSGSISNENTPYVENNFTPYPTVQKVGRKGLSGKLRAWVGGVKDTQFRDSVKMVDDLMDLSTRNTVKFLRDRKGNLRMIEISDAIVKETQDKYAEQPVQIEIPWVEVGDAKDCQIVSLLTDGLMARGDDIIDTTTAISVDQDGYVTWTMDPDGYIGSEIQMNEGGQLEQVYDNSMKYVPADLEINNEGKLKVETVIKADE